MDFHEGLGVFDGAADTSFWVTRVLKLPAYRRLLAAYTLNELAWGIGSLALAVLVYNRTGNALAAAGYFLCAMFLPALISPALVARVDQLASRPVLVTLYALEAVIFAILARVAGQFALAPVLVLVVLDGLIAVSARALTRTATVTITSAAGLLREGNAITNTSFSICYMVGPAVGGLTVAVGSVSTALLVTSGVFVAMGLTLATARGLPGAAIEHDPTAGRLRAALGYARATPHVRALLIVLGASVLFGSIPIPVEVVLTSHTLHAGAGGYGGLLSAWGAGAVIGSAIYARWRSVPGWAMIAFGSCALAAGYGVMALAPSLGVAIAGAAIAGVGNGTVFVASRTTLQEAVRPDWMALMMSLTESIIQGLPGAGILIGGTLAAVAGPRAALALGAAGSVVVGFAVWLGLRELEPAPLQSLAQEPIEAKAVAS